MTNNPPCVQHALEDNEKCNAAKLLIASYMFEKWKSLDEIISLFPNEKRYQIEHVAGLRGSPRVQCPSCKKVLSQGNCYATEECNGISNPIEFRGCDK